MQALDLRRQGRKQREIATILDVTEAAVSQWLATARRGGPEALRSRPRPGPRPRLTDEELHRLPDFLWHGPEAYGFRGEVWTCGRIAGVIAQEFGIRYSESQVSRLLKQLEWTPQVPIVRAIQRDEAAIERWRAELWPELLHRARREHRELVFVDESGFYLLPGVVKTYAPKGRTPVVREWQTRDHLSVIGAVTPCGKIYTMVRQESLNSLHIIEFLLHLGHADGGPAVDDLGRIADPPMCGSRGIPGRGRPGDPSGAAAALRPGSQSGGVDVGTSQAGRAAQPGVLGLGDIAYGASPGPRAPPPEVEARPFLL